MIHHLDRVLPVYIINAYSGNQHHTFGNFATKEEAEETLTSVGLIPLDNTEKTKKFVFPYTDPHETMRTTVASVIAEAMERVDIPTLGDWSDFIADTIIARLRSEGVFVSQQQTTEVADQSAKRLYEEQVRDISEGSSWETLSPAARDGWKYAASLVERHNHPQDPLKRLTIDEGHDMVTKAVQALMPYAVNETQAYNMWNNINQNSDFAYAMSLLHSTARRAPKHPEHSASILEALKDKFPDRPVYLWRADYFWITERTTSGSFLTEA